MRVDATIGGSEMTTNQLNYQVARITGEPIHYISSLGFSLLRPSGESMEPEDIELVLPCAFCGRPVPYPGCATADSEPMAECERCDVYFGFDTFEVYATAVQKPSTMTRRRRNSRDYWPTRLSPSDSSS
jgi:hypothetical protein